jgi:TolA-binding protein
MTNTPSTSTTVIASIFLLVSILAVVTIYNSNQSTTSTTGNGMGSAVKGAATEVPVADSSSTPIPPSSDGAKAYIKQAADAAAAGDYRQAIDILSEGIRAYPSDQNLALTQGYYENEALRHGQ